MHQAGSVKLINDVLDMVWSEFLLCEVEICEFSEEFLDSV